MKNRKDIKNYYEEQIGKCGGFFDLLKKEIKKLVATHKNIHLLSVNGRKKEFWSFERKVAERNVKPQEIGDLFGLRIICLTQDDLKKMHELIEKLAPRFSIMPERHQPAPVSPLGIEGLTPIKLRASGYSSIHYSVELGGYDSEFDEFLECRCEIQLRTIIEHALAEITHTLLYKKGIPIPDEIEEDFSNLSSYLRISDVHVEILRERIKRVEVERIRRLKGSEEISPWLIRCYLSCLYGGDMILPDKDSYEIFTELKEKKITNFNFKELKNRINNNEKKVKSQIWEEEKRLIFASGHEVEDARKLFGLQDKGKKSSSPDLKYHITLIEGKPKDWLWDPQQKALRHIGKVGEEEKSLGIIQLVSVRDSSGREIYQQPWWLESRGEVDIVVDEHQRFVLVEAERHAVIPPENYRDVWDDKAPPEPYEYQNCAGVVSLELPRGFCGSLIQEAEEETRLKVELVAIIGHSNANTSFFGTSPFVVVCKARPIQSDRHKEPNENIRKVILKSPEEVARMTTLCNFTKGALWDFCRWAFTTQPDPWWKQVAEMIVNGWKRD